MQKMKNNSSISLSLSKGCPVVMCSPAKLEKSAFEELSMSDRQLICSSLIHCINWFRELVRDSHNNDKNLMSGQFGHLIK